MNWSVFLISQGSSSSYFLIQHIYVNHTSSCSYISCTLYRVLCVSLLQGFFLDDQTNIADSLGFLLLINLHRHIIPIPFRGIRNYKAPVFQFEFVALIPAKRLYLLICIYVVALRAGLVKPDFQYISVLFPLKYISLPIAVSTSCHPITYETFTEQGTAVLVWNNVHVNWLPPIKMQANLGMFPLPR